MDNEITADEINLIEYAKEAVVKYNKIRHSNGGIDTLYAFLLSDRGNTYDEGNATRLGIHKSEA
jgi:hypothetical protein